MLINVVQLFQKRLNYDRGMIMLVDKKSATLRYAAGYGQNLAEEAIFKQTKFHLDNPESKGIFVLAIRDQRFALSIPLLYTTATGKSSHEIY